MEVFYKKVVLKTCNFIKRTPAQVFPCEYCEILKNTYFGEYLRTATSKFKKHDLGELYFGTLVLVIFLRR